MVQERQLAAIDTFGLALAVTAIAALFATQHYSARALATLLKDLASPDTVPAVTRMTLAPAFPVGIAAVSLATLALAFAQRSSRVRRALMLAIFALIVLSFLMTLLGWYLPIFAIANAIKAD
jgi:cytochrome bd-type quinol oxidase subunit 1